MQFQAPNFSDRTLDQIISEKIYFDSAGYAYRALSWLDIAKKRRNICALQYAALDIRQAIEQLLFEQLVLSVGGKLDRVEYARCKGSSTKLNRMIKKLSPDYSKLAEFTQAITSVDSASPHLIIWDHDVLMKHWRGASKYLHWSGEPAETVESVAWFEAGVQTVKDVANHIWEKVAKGCAGIMMPDAMQPESRQLWERFKAGVIDLEGIQSEARTILLILRNRETL